MKWLAVPVVVILVLLLAAWLAWRSLPRPTLRGPEGPPPATAASLTEVLDRLERAIEEHTPAVAAALRPGLAEAEIDRIGQEHGLRLPADVRALYRWRDGLEREAGVTLFDGLGFPPLAWLAESNTASREQLADATWAQKLVHRLLLSHQEDWVELFPDGMGNGVFVDPDRSPDEGSTFLHDHVEGPDFFFRSLATLLEAFAEGHGRGLHAEPSAGWDDGRYDAIREVYERRGRRPAWPEAGG